MDYAGHSDRVVELFAELSNERRCAFAVAGVERLAPAFTRFNAGRESDVRTFQHILDELWRFSSGDPVDVAELATQIDRFPEIHSDEESDGREYYGERAVDALLYAVEAAAGDQDAVWNSVGLLMGVMGHLSDEFEDVDLFPHEVQHQQADCDILSAKSHLAQQETYILREGSWEFGERVFELVRQVPPT